MEPRNEAPLRTSRPGDDQVVDQLATRRLVGRLVRVALVVLAFAIAASWLAGRVNPRHGSGNRLPDRIVKSDVLGPGDVRIVSINGGVSLTLQGDRLLAGLSPEQVAKIRAGLEASAAKDTGGLGGSIAQMVKKTVSDNISAQLAYSLADISDMRYDDGLIVLVHEDGKTQRLFESTKVDNEKPRFSSEDAQRIIAAFHERKGTLP